MKFSPEHRPLSMTGVASVAGFAVFMMLFFFTATFITGPEAAHDAPVPPGRDSVAVRTPESSGPAPATTAAPATAGRIAPLTESVRASLLAAASAAQYGRPAPRVKGQSVPPNTSPASRASAPPRATREKPGPGVARSKVNGSVTMGPIQWIGGGRRKKVSGALPVFPAGVAANAQIKVEAVVAPDGRVRSVRPGQKGNAKWEDAAIRAVQRWKFDKLARSIPQRDHRCVVSFTFSVK